MRCLKCGTWNKPYLPNCTKCGAPMPRKTEEKHSWEDKLHDKKPFLQIIKFEEDDREQDQQDALEASKHFNKQSQNNLTDELEELALRRETGKTRIAALQEKAAEFQRSIQEAEIIRPVAESESSTAPRRHISSEDEYKGTYYASPRQTVNTSESAASSKYVYTDNPDAPVYHDGYEPESSLSDYPDSQMPRRAPFYPGQNESSIARQESSDKKQKKVVRRVLVAVLILLLCGAFAVGGVLAARFFVIQQGVQLRRDNEAFAECFESEADGHPAHTIIIHGRENATVYLQETASNYVVADGIVSVTIPDYMWYDTDSSIYAKAVDTDTMDVTVSPFIRYSQEGEQYEIEPIHFTIDVPLSPVYLLNPATIRAEVGVSIFEVRVNVQSGSTVIIDGTNVSTLIRETGNVSKNVQVLPVGDNTISISVKSKYCRENKMEVVLYRAPQEIPLELVPTVITEWNYEADDPIHQASISGSTLPGATITIESPYEDLVVNNETGDFKFKPLFRSLGNNDVVIRSSYEGRADSVITHTVYYMPTADVYTRKAWDLDSQYSDLINYINIRKGQIYVGTGVITRIISSTPQMAIINIGNELFDKFVLLENSSKTTWTVGTKYRIYGEAYGLYDTMPRLTVRYTYLVD